MEVNEPDRFEPKSRALEQELKAHRRVAIQAHTRLIEHSSKIKTAHAEFKKIKESLVNAKSNTKVVNPQEKLLRAKQIKEALSAANAKLKNLSEIEVKLQHEKLMAIKSFKVTKQRSERIKSEIKQIKLENEKRCDDRELEESIELKAAQDLQNDTQGISNTLDDSNQRTSSQSNAQGEKYAAPSGQPPVETGENSQSFKSVPESRAPKFHLGQAELSELRSWEGLKGQGVSFTAHTSSGRELDVVITSSGDNKVRIDLKTTTERDKRSLRRDREEIIEALESEGYQVQEFSVRGEQI